MRTICSKSAFWNQFCRRMRACLSCWWIEFFEDQLWKWIKEHKSLKFPLYFAHKITFCDFFCIAFNILLKLERIDSYVVCWFYSALCCVVLLRFHYLIQYVFFLVLFLLCSSACSRCASVLLPHVCPSTVTILRLFCHFFAPFVRLHFAKGVNLDIVLRACDMNIEQIYLKRDRNIETKLSHSCLPAHHFWIVLAAFATSPTLSLSHSISSISWSSSLIPVPLLLLIPSPVVIVSISFCFS